MYIVEVTMHTTKEPVLYMYKHRLTALWHISVELLHGHVCTVYYERGEIQG